jgi:ATP-dependent DNA helicase RecQ
MMLKVLDVDGAVRRVRGGWTATGEPWTYDADRYGRVARVRQDEQRAMLDYLATPGCRMRYLREQLDDPLADDCGRCDNCGGLSLPTEISERVVSGADDRLRRPGVTVDPRRLWPAGMASLGIDVKGKIAADEQAEPGRALARFTDLGYGQRIRTLLADNDAGTGGEVPADLLAAVVEVLAAWRWQQRPTAVVHVGSHRHPGLIADLAAKIGAIGRLPDLGAVPHLRSSADGRSNSAQRLRQVHGAYALPDELAARLAQHRDEPVLLVDDFTDTGWTLTVVAGLLRRAGAGAVCPLVLGIAG